MACFECEFETTIGKPLFRNGVDPEMPSDRGSRRSLALEHMACMAVYRIRVGCAQDALHGVFGID